MEHTLGISLPPIPSLQMMVCRPTRWQYTVYIAEFSRIHGNHGSAVWGEFSEQVRIGS
jgi:hypothetical protein